MNHGESAGGLEVVDESLGWGQGEMEKRVESSGT